MSYTLNYASEPPKHDEVVESQGAWLFFWLGDTRDACLAVLSYPILSIHPSIRHVPSLLI